MPEDEVNSAWQQALALEEAGRVDEAQALYARIAEARAQDGDHFGAGRFWQYAGNEAQAVEEYGIAAPVAEESGDFETAGFAYRFARRFADADRAFGRHADQLRQEGAEPISIAIALRYAGRGAEADQLSAVDA